MIETLHIKNIGIIDDLVINLKNGFNVLTGETGSGKSLIINSIDILSGGRFSKEMIRKDQEFSFIEAYIQIDNSENIDKNYIIVSREIHVNGKNLCKINGRFVTVSELKNYMKNIIDIHGQFDNQNLMDTKTHLLLLDKYCGEELKKISSEYEVLFSRYNKIEGELNKCYGNDIERQRKLDLLYYQLNEIKEADLKLGEEEELNNKKILMKNFEKVSDALNIASFKLENNILIELEEIIKPLEKIENISNEYKNKLSGIQDIYYELQEDLLDFNSYKENLEFNEEECNYVQNRLDLIFSLKRKYGNSIDEILKYSMELEREIVEIESLEQHNNILKKEKKDIENKMLELAIAMNSVRNKYSSILEDRINEELKFLDMKNAKFKVDLRFDDQRKFNKYGLSLVEFLINTNIGEDFKQLIKVASGGEISRIMLAIKSVLSSVDDVQTIVFDEIDTGISGAAVKAVAEKIKMISKKYQVIAVTHQPILTASADSNYKIEKIVKNGKTNTNVRKLSEDEIINEIAKISNGSITTIAIEHALELRKVSLCS